MMLYKKNPDFQFFQPAQNKTCCTD